MNEREAAWRPELRTVLLAPLPHLPERHRRLLVRLLAAGFGRGLSVEGAGRLAEASDPVILALNHNNSIESLTIPAVVQLLRDGRPAAWLVDWMYLRIPVTGWVIRQGDPIPVYRKRARWGAWERHRRANRHRDPLAEALERLAGGGSVGVFPEGTRNRRADRLLRGRAGLGRPVLGSAAPVVPIGIHYPAAERLGRIPRAGRSVLRVGAPLHFAAEREAWRAAAAAGERPGGATSRRLGRAVVERVMAELAALSGKARPGRVEPIPTTPQTPVQRGAEA